MTSRRGLTPVVQSSSENDNPSVARQQVSNALVWYLAGLAGVDVRFGLRCPGCGVGFRAE
jgi:hypothetical protein